VGERIDLFEEPLDHGKLTLFRDNPIEFLCATVAHQLSCIPQFKAIFGEFIDGYMRMDYDIRNLPSLRVYNEQFTKEFESWFITGDLKLDVIWPANLRRTQTQQFQDTMASALLQQFRSNTFFGACNNAVPGLNELGKTLSADKTLGFDFEDNMVPLTQITANFRLDLRIWDIYLEAEGRTKELPFDVTLANLTKIANTIQALRDDGENGPSVPITSIIAPTPITPTSPVSIITQGAPAAPCETACEPCKGG
jgi:hypothetical protein